MLQFAKPWGYELNMKEMTVDALRICYILLNNELRNSDWLEMPNFSMTLYRLEEDVLAYLQSPFFPLSTCNYSLNQAPVVILWLLLLHPIPLKFSYSFFLHLQFSFPRKIDWGISENWKSESMDASLHKDGVTLPIIRGP